MTLARMSAPTATVFAAAMLFGGAVGHAVAAAPTSEIPGGRYVYVIKHDSRGDIGRVVNTVRVNGETVTIRSRERIEVKVLGLVAYRQSADRRETWAGATLTGFTGRTDADGKVSTVRAARSGGSLAIDSSNGPRSASGMVAPANPWRIEAMAAGKLLDVVAGDIKAVTITEIGAARIKVAGRSVTTRHFRISGSMRREVWYDGTGVAVKMRFFHGNDVIDMTLVDAPSIVPQNAQR